MIHKVPTSDLQPGMYVVNLNLSPQEFPGVYCEEGLLLTSAQTSGIIRQGYREAFVDDEKSIVPITPQDAWENLLEDADGRESTPGPDLPDPHTMRTNLERAVSMYTAAIKTVDQLFDILRKGKPVPVTAVGAVADTIVEHITSDQLTLATVTKLQVQDNYTSAHCVNVSVLGTLFARHLNMDNGVLHNMALAGLLHDIGKAAIPPTLLDTARPLTDAEFSLMKNHVLAGYEAVHTADGLDDTVKKAVLEHHERYDGSGYPHGKKGNEISLFGRILAVVDVYDALTSKKAYKPALLPYTAVSFLYGQREQGFDPAVVERFIQCMGIYPVGSVVKLSTGETGVVYQANPQKPLMPIVSVVMNKENDKRPLKMLDLGQDGAPRIKACLDPVRTGINCMAVLKACAWAQRKMPGAPGPLSAFSGGSGPQAV